MGRQAAALGKKIVSAHRDRYVLDGLSHPWLSLEEAYSIAFKNLERREADGDRRVGWKIGYASSAMRHQMNVTEPNFGPLMESMLLVSDGMVSDDLVQPRVEPEVLVVLGKGLEPGARLSSVRQAVTEVRCALEVVDSVWAEYRFTLEENTADGSSAAHAVIGPALDSFNDLVKMPVALEVGGMTVSTASGAEAMGHPFAAVQWLARALAQYEQSLGAGDIILTGGLTAAALMPPGVGAIARFGSAQEFVVKCSRRPAR